MGEITASTTQFRWEKIQSTIMNTPTWLNSSGFYFHSLTLVGSNIFVLGKIGRRRNTISSLAIFDLRTYSWSILSILGRYAPYSFYHTGFLVDDFVYMYGGEQYENLHSPELFRLDVQLLEWMKCDTRGEAPPGRSGHAGEYLERLNMFVCFGGEISGGINTRDNNVWALNMDGLAWIRPEVKGKKPSPRRGHSSCCVGNTLFFYGGRNGNQSFDELNILHCSRANFWWSEPRVYENKKLTDSSLAHIAGRLFVFGGYSQSLVDQNEVFAIKLSNLEIQTVSPKLGEKGNYVRGSIESFMGHAALVYNGKMIVIGGYGKEVQFIHVLKAWQ